MTTETKPSALAIVGIGCVFPKAKTLREYWANIKDKVDAIRDVPPSHWRHQDYFDADPKKPDHVYAYKGGFLEPYDFDPAEFGLAPNTLEATDPAQLFGLVAAKMALADAGYPVDKDGWDRSRVSVILGVTGALELVVPLGARLGHPYWRRALAEAGVPDEQAQDVIARVADAYVPWQENSFPGLLGNVVAGRIANRFNLGGTNCVVDAACASSLSAAHLAALELQTGRARMVVTGGVDAFNDIFMYTCFTKTPALSPSGHSRPFDAKADGTTLGEGAGMVVLKRLEDAEKDGDRVYAVIRGIGSASDGRGKSIYAPSADGQVRALREAYRVAGVSADTVELVEAHGTGTAVGDGIEVEALAQVYRESGRDGVWCALGSVKSMIGHTKAAAGSAALVKAAMALHHKVFPPTIKVTEPLPILAGENSPFYLSLEKRPWPAPQGHPRRAACSALGFGGTNFHAVLEEHEARKSRIDWDGATEIAAFSGRDAGELAQKLAPWTAAAAWDERRTAAQASRATFDPSAPVRLVLVLERAADAGALCAKAASLLSARAGETSWSSPEGIFFASGKPGKLGVLFPGQGAQYVGMGRDLFCQFPQAFAVLENADAAGESPRLSDAIFPRPAWTPERKDAQERALRATDAAQPALGAAGLGALRVLEFFGLKADAYAGHSYGELVALHAAGRYDEKTLHALSRLRGRLMAGADRGAMLAVQAPAADVERAVKEERLDLVLANKNAPAQNVLSGAKSEIERAEKVLAARGMKTVRLPVAAAFHSPLVADALGPLAAALKDAAFARSTAAVYADATGDLYPADPAKARELLAGQLARPVEFVTLVGKMHADGVRTFIECGPGGRLTGLIGQILAGKDFVAAAVDASNGRKSGITDLARVLAQVAALGHALDLTLWQDGEAGLKDVRPKPKMSVVLTGAPYRSTAPQSRPLVRTPVLPASPAPSALAAAQASIDALTRLQEQTAQLHLQFLRGQEAAQSALQSLIEQQQSSFSGVVVPIAAPITVPVVVSAPVTAPLPASLPAPQASVLPVLLSVVSEKTGYPAETIGADMDLEADLGIDSIKRVEILSAIQEKLPNAPKVKPEHLGTLRTLKAIADYLSQGTSAPAAAPIAAPAPTSVSAPTAAPGSVLPALLSVVSEKTGYPAETIGADMDLEADLGIDSIKRVEILSAIQEKLPNAPKVKPEHLGTLRTLNAIADYLSQGTSVPAVAPAPVVPVAAPVPAASTIASAGLQRLVPELVPVGPRDAFPFDKTLTVAVTRDSGLDQALVRELRARGFKAEVVSADDPASLPARLGALVVVAPARPAAAGCPWTEESEIWLKKAFRMVQEAGRSFEKSGTRGLVVSVTRMDGALGFSGGDYDPAFGGVAGLLKTASREWKRVCCRAIDVDPGLSADSAAKLLARELGYEGPVETALSEAGTRGVMLVERALPADGRDPLAPGDALIVTGGARGVTAEAAVALAKAFKPRLVLVGRSPLPSAEPAHLSSAVSEADLRRVLAARKAGLSPKELGRRAKEILVAREIRAALSRLAEVGAEVRYRALDVRDAAAVAALAAETVRDWGPVRGIVHGAGILADKLIVDKTGEQVDAVLDTKLAGLRHLLNAVAPKDLRLLVLFSSSTARYGRNGQSDYAVANEVLNKAAQALSRRLPSCRTAAVGWGPWDGGMVNADLKKLFAAEGVGVIGLQEGGRHLVAETRAEGQPPETVVLARAQAPVAFERDLNVRTHPVLAAHVLAGRPVVPLALSAEWLAHAALHENPGLVFAGFDDLRVTKATALDSSGATVVRVHAGSAERREGLFVVPAEIRGGDGALRARARVLLAAKRPSAPAPALSVKGPPYPRALESAYREILFHGPELQVLLAVSSCGPEGIVAETRTAPPPSSWMQAPVRDHWLADPAALDAAFQALILWTSEELGAPCLPSYVARYRQFVERFPESGVRLVVKAARRGEGLAEADVEFLDERGALVARLEGCECAVDPALSAAFR